jgi:hypothetical protein
MTKRGALTIAACFAAFILASLPAWREPIMGDEVYIALAMKAVSRPEMMSYLRGLNPLFGLWHPPAYVHLGALLGGFFGFGEAAIRLMGIASFLVSLVLIWLIAEGTCEDPADGGTVAGLACAIFAFNPLAVRGAMLVDIDGSILNAALLLFMYAMSRTKDLSTGKFAGLSVLFALSLWTKLTTPPILIGAMLLRRVIRRDGAGLLRVAAVAAVGTAAFLATWAWYARAHGLPFDIIFGHLINTLTGFASRKTSSASAAGPARTIWTLLVWCSPSFLLLGVAACLKTSFENTREDSLLPIQDIALYGLCALAAYMVIGGITHTFPKYHYAILAPLAIVMARSARGLLGTETKTIVIAALIFAVYGVLIVGDPLYAVNYALKEGMIHGGTARSLAFKAGLPTALLLLAPPTCYAFFRFAKTSAPLRDSLAATMLAANLALLIVQARAGYNTVYCYGGAGVKEAADFVRANTDPTKPILAPPEIDYLANDDVRTFDISDRAMLHDAPTFMKTVRESGSPCVVYGVTGNTVEQYQNVFNNPEVRAFLESGYTRRDIGSYSVWLKKRA